VAVGVAASGVTVGVASGVAVGVASGVAVGVVSWVAAGVLAGVTVGVASGVTAGVLAGGAVAVASGVVAGLGVGVAVDSVPLGEQLARRQAVTNRTPLRRRETAMDRPGGLCMLCKVYHSRSQELKNSSTQEGKKALKSEFSSSSRTAFRHFGRNIY
jgi:hypothetical protein